MIKKIVIVVFVVVFIVAIIANTDQSTIDKSTIDKSTTDQSTTEQLTTDQSTAEQSTTEESTTDKSTTDQSTTDQSTTEQSMTKDQFEEILKIYPDVVGEWEVDKIAVDPFLGAYSKDGVELIGNKIKITEKGNIYFNNKIQLVESFEHMITKDFESSYNYTGGSVETEMGGSDILYIIVNEIGILVGPNGIYVPIVEQYNESGLYSMVRLK